MLNPRCRRLENYVSEHVMTSNSVPRVAAAKSVITHTITWQGAGGTESCIRVDRKAQSVLENWNELKYRLGLPVYSAAGPCPGAMEEPTVVHGLRSLPVGHARAGGAPQLQR